MHLIRRGIAVASLMVLTYVGVDAPAFASTSANFGKFSCTVKSLPPTLSKGSLTGTAQIDCNVSTTVIVEFGVVELDGAVEDRVEVTFQRRSVAVIAGRSTVIPTATASCISTESGNEEMATRSRVTLSGTVSLWDRTTPPNDSYAC